MIITSDAGHVIKECVDKGFPLATGTEDEIYEKVKSLYNTHILNPLIVGDINPIVAGKNIENKLLKVLEEIHIDSIFVSSVDCFSLIFLSRFMQVIKNVQIYKVGGNSKLTFIHFLKNNEESLSKVLKEFPEGLEMYYRYRQSKIPVKNKLLEFLEV